MFSCSGYFWLILAQFGFSSNNYGLHCTILPEGRRRKVRTAPVFNLSVENWEAITLSLHGENRSFRTSDRAWMSSNERYLYKCLAKRSNIFIQNRVYHTKRRVAKRASIVSSNTEQWEVIFSECNVRRLKDQRHVLSTRCWMTMFDLYCSLK